MSTDHGQHPRKAYPPPSCDEQLITVNQTRFSKLMSLKSFTGPGRTALAVFKNMFNKSEWMRDQRGYLQRACLAAASGLASGAAYCRCGLNYKDHSGRYRFQTCGQEHVCPSCNYHNRVVPCEREYLPAFDRAPYWHAFTVSWQSSPERAGMHWVTKQDAKGKATARKHWRPFADNPSAPVTYRYAPDQNAALSLMAELPFKFAEALRKAGWVDGLYCNFEWDFAFYPGKHECLSICLPHMHCFANSAQPLTYEDGIEIQKLYQRTCLKHLGNDKLPAYPDIEIAPILSQERLKGWMNYQIKSMPIEKFYHEGLRHGCALAHLNIEFHQTVWDSVKLVHSPRKYGNLYALTPGYIGIQQFKKLSKPQHERLTQMLEDGLTLTAKETRLLEHHTLACEQQRQYRAETEQRRAQAKVKREEEELKAKRQ